MFEFPTDKDLASVGLTRQEFQARYIDRQRQRVCEPLERFHHRILTQFYLDYPQLVPEPPPSRRGIVLPFTRADEEALLAEAEYFDGVTKGDAA